MRTKMHILALMAATVLTGSCNVLDQYPHNAISRNHITGEHIDLLFNGLYNYAQYKPTNNGYLMGDFLGGDFMSNSATVYATPALWIQSLVLPTSGFVSGPWNGYYSWLYQVNEFIELAGQQPMTSKLSQQLGAAYYFRGLIYYNLTSRWRSVPILDHVTNEALKNAPEADCWAFTEENLRKAIDQCPIFSSKWYVSQDAARALMARTLLAQGKKAEAATMAEEVITSGRFALESWSKIFRFEDNREEIFSYCNRMTENGISFSDDFYRSSGAYVPSNTLINLYTSSDRRLPVAIDNLDGATVLGKYINNGDTYHQIYVSRLAEMYLISAEGLGYNNGGAERLNELRAARGLGALTITSEAQMLERVLAERRLELVGEGFRWFDLVRTGKYPATLGLDNKYTVLPLPTRELDLNANLEQNELWK